MAGDVALFRSIAHFFVPEDCLLLAVTLKNSKLLKAIKQQNEQSDTLIYSYRYYCLVIPRNIFFNENQTACPIRYSMCFPERTNKWCRQIVLTTLSDN